RFSRDWSSDVCSSDLRIDPKRAAVIERWQASSRQNPHRVYRVADVDERLNWLISHETSFRKVEDPWVAVEKYVHGRIVDWGGKVRVNVHLEMDDGTVDRKSTRLNSSHVKISYAVF